MAQSVHTFQDPRPAGFSALEAAIYSRDMLLSLKGIAARQGQNRLADLLDAAAQEAARLAAPADVSTQSAE
jgi:hypothetical protein